MVGPNPNPARITDELWNFWAALQALEPTSQLGGIYASKPGYHNTRAANDPRNYSVTDAEDKQGPSDKSAALDWTFPEAHSGDYRRIGTYSSRLLASGRDLNDPRGNDMREFFGQADTDAGVEGWDFRYVTTSTADSSHLWHIHFSFDRGKVTSRTTFDNVLSILRGETVEQWRAQQGDDDVAFRIRITSSDPEWNDKVVIGGGGTRFTARQPGVIHGALAKLYPTEIQWNDASRGDLSWDSFLDGVLGEDIGVRVTNLDARFAELETKIDSIDGTSVDHTHEVPATETGAATPIT